MSMRFIIGTLLSFTLLAGGCTASSRTSESVRSRPANVVVILTDDAGYADFGFTGCTDFPTPNIDRIAHEGVTCTSGYVTASVCCPSRAGMMTGRYQQRFGHEVNLLAGTKAYQNEGLPRTELTLADRMRAEGYATCALGKWHLGVSEGFHPLDRGFDEYYGCLSGSRSYWAYDEVPKHNRGLMRNRDLIAPEPDDDYYFTDALTDEAVDFIHRHADEPFLLFVSYTAVHTPMHATQEMLDRHPDVTPERRRKLAAMTSSLDDGVGRILDAIDRDGLDEDTVVIFINDNGGATNNASDNGIYRGMKGSKWEGGIRIPYAVRWPGTLPAGRIFDHPVSTLDIVPTAVAAAGGTIEAGAVDGVDLVPFMQDAEAGAPHEQLFWRRSVASAVREGDWKLIEVEGNPVLLFNLAEDPSETTNLAAEHPERVAAMERDLAEWESELAEPRWGHAKRYRENQILKHRMEVQGRAAERKLP